MAPPIHVHALSVNAEQANEFFMAINHALHLMTVDQRENVYLFNEPLEAINISYDGNFNPFLGFTTGRNLEEQRVYLAEDTWLLIQIGDFLSGLKLPISGGRVGFNSHYVVKRLADNTVITLCLFDWHGEDVWDKCKTLLEDAKNNA